jgi:hypothetical protein
LGQKRPNEANGHFSQFFAKVPKNSFRCFFQITHSYHLGNKVYVVIISTDQLSLPGPTEKPPATSRLGQSQSLKRSCINKPKTKENVQNISQNRNK